MSVVHMLDRSGGGGGGGGKIETPPHSLPLPSRALAGGQRNGATPPPSNYAGAGPPQPLPSSLSGGGPPAQAATNGRFASDQANGRFEGATGGANGRLSADWVKTLGVVQPTADTPVGDTPVGDTPVGEGVKRWSRQQRDWAQGDRKCSSRGCRKVNHRP